MKTPQRFASKYVIAPNGCHIWIAGFRRGGGRDYPTFSVDGASIYARRHAFEERYGPVAPGMMLEAMCGDHRCVRDVHLVERTPTQIAESRRARGGYIVRRGAVRRVTPADVAGMQFLRSLGRSVGEISANTGFCLRTVQYVMGGHRDALEHGGATYGVAA